MKEMTARLREMLTMFLVLVTAIVVVFVAQLTLEVRSELVRVKTAIQAIRTDPKAREASLQPFAVFDEKCVSCHSDRKFLGVHGTSSELQGIIAKMEKLPDVHLSAQERDRVHASLELLKCVRCHGEVNLKKLAPMGTAERLEIIRRMREKPDSGMAPEESAEILRAYQKIQGF
ncbi:MAG: hypothetical protein A3J27_10250 [Candidatus Tectomicrobia bacterium RIFCSPLOWO2_12_FULL_69_37]|nr:MAG: hypothetical protein A3J27_10250 [Candidatus Tectomicrobia bacterium RIFCSPLOWO2_12_FULL_69_37]